MHFFRSLGFDIPKRKGVPDFLQEVSGRKDQQVRSNRVVLAVLGGWESHRRTQVTDGSFFVPHSLKGMILKFSIISRPGRFGPGERPKSQAIVPSVSVRVLLREHVLLCIP